MSQLPLGWEKILPGGSGRFFWALPIISGHWTEALGGCCLVPVRFTVKEFLILSTQQNKELVGIQRSCSPMPLLMVQALHYGTLSLSFIGARRMTRSSPMESTIMHVRIILFHRTWQRQRKHQPGCPEPVFCCCWICLQSCDSEKLTTKCSRQILTVPAVPSSSGELRTCKRNPKITTLSLSRDRARLRLGQESARSPQSRNAQS